MLQKWSAVAVPIICAIVATCNGSLFDAPRDPGTPHLPAQQFGYAVPLPLHFARGAPNSPGFADNTPPDNPVTDAGATLGRVLFYDRRLSANNAISCASCHLQSHAFADTARFSRGFKGGRTGRHSMSLANARFYQNRRFFWDERAISLEAQVLQPIADTVEMGLTHAEMIAKLSATSFYPPLFAAAFGNDVISTERVARALAQFVRSMVSANSRFDAALANAEAPGFGLLTSQERQGMQIFNGAGRCASCHVTTAQISPAAFNNGLDSVIVDRGAGNGRFKAPSLRNIELTAPYMHDGRFATLEEVVEHYDNSVKANPGLDPRLRNFNGQAGRLGLSSPDKAALVAFLKALTDHAFTTDPRFSDPFR
jgi:cytochrome c peroxidase